MRLHADALMRCCASFLPVHPCSRAVRLAIVLAAAPVLALSSLSTEAILVHYDGYDIHTHTAAFNDLDGWVETAKHQHASHEHDCQLHDPHEHGDDFLIVLDLPDAFLRGRGLPTGITSVAASSLLPRTIAATPTTDTVNPPTYERIWSGAPNLRAGNKVTGILLSNHALLL